MILIRFSNIYVLQGGVSVQKCHEELDSRVTISGDYDSHECGLTVTGLEVEDAGTWECEVRGMSFIGISIEP